MSESIPVSPSPGPRRAEGVSAVITAYNAAWCIERVLDSIFAQTLVPAEVLVADDGSTDDTIERIERRYGDAVRVLRLPHRGLTPSRIASVAAASGPWIAVVDADDTWLPDKIERQLAFLERHPELRWLSSDGMIVAAEGVVGESWLAAYFTPIETRIGDLYPAMVQRCFALVSSSMIHLDAYHAVGGYDAHIEYSQDYSLWLKLSARFPCGVMSDRLITYWTSPTQLSKRIEERYRDDMSLMERVAHGEYRTDAATQRLGREKVASYEFDLGVICLRSGRVKEGQAHLWRAVLGPGPLRRRAMALFGALTPRGALRGLMRSPWLKGAVHRSRRTNPMIPPPERSDP